MWLAAMLHDVTLVPEVQMDLSNQLSFELQGGIIAHEYLSYPQSQVTSETRQWGTSSSHRATPATSLSKYQIGEVGPRLQSTVNMHILMRHLAGRGIDCPSYGYHAARASESLHTGDTPRNYARRRRWRPTKRDLAPLAPGDHRQWGKGVDSQQKPCRAGRANTARALNQARVPSNNCVCCTAATN